MNDEKKRKEEKRINLTYNTHTQKNAATDD